MYNAYDTNINNREYLKRLYKRLHFTFKNKSKSYEETDDAIDYKFLMTSDKVSKSISELINELKENGVSYEDMIEVLTEPFSKYEDNYMEKHNEEKITSDNVGEYADILENNANNKIEERKFNPYTDVRMMFAFLPKAGSSYTGIHTLAKYNDHYDWLNKRFSLHKEKVEQLVHGYIDIYDCKLDKIYCTVNLGNLAIDEDSKDSVLQSFVTNIKNMCIREFPDIPIVSISITDVELKMNKSYIDSPVYVVVGNSI